MEKKKKEALSSALSGVEGTLSKNTLALFEERRKKDEEVLSDPLYTSWCVLKDFVDQCDSIIESLELENCEKRLLLRIYWITLLSPLY